VTATDSAAGARRASDAKTAKAATRNYSLAGDALTRAALLSDVPARWLDVARAVRDTRGATWEQIGATLGMGKYEAAGCFRRLLVATGLKQPYERRNT
jgi:hypothetical protein